MIHAFTTREAAQAYVDWQMDHSDDDCCISEIELVDRWEQPRTKTAFGQ